MIPSRSIYQEKLEGAIERIMFNNDWTQDQLAARLGTSRLSVNQLVKGKRRITPEMAVRLEAVSDLEAEGWMRLQMLVDLHDVRTRGFASRAEKLPLDSR